MAIYAVAVDGSAHSKKAIDLAVTLMNEEDQLHLVTVTKKEEQRSTAVEMLQTFASEVRVAADAVHKVVLVGGDARAQLCSYVSKFDIDCLVVGTRGLGAVKRVLLGSVSDYIVQHATCDVVVAK